MATNTLPKTERLKSRKSIESLFRSGKSFSSPPFRMLYRRTDDKPAPVQMTVAVPKRYIKRAVDRNLIKRRTREAYRLQKQQLLKAVAASNSCFELVFLYQSTDIADYKTIQSAIRVLLMRLQESVRKN